MTMKLSSVAVSLRSKLAGNTGVVAGTVLLQNMIRVVGSMILTRLLTAEAFGVVGIITSVSVTFALISDIGITAFIVRHQDSSDARFVDEVWTLRLIRSIALSVLMAVAAGPIASFLGKPELQWPIAVGGLFFLLDGADSMAFLTALRSRQIKRLSVLDVLSQVVGLLLSVALAFLLRSYWSIIVANLAGLVFRAWLSYVCFPGSSRRWRFSKARMQEMWSFSRFITGSTILTLVISQTDKVVLSRLFPLDVFGIYIIAAGLAAAPVGLANAYASRILFPIYSATIREQPDLINRQYYQQKRLTSLAFVLAIGVMIGTAPLIIRLLYDDRYLPAVAYLQILLVSTLFSLNNMSINEVMIAIGWPKFTLNANIVRLLFLAAGGVLAYARFGIPGLIWVIGTIEAAAQIYGWFALHQRGLLKRREEAMVMATGAAAVGAGAAASALFFYLWR